MAPVEAIDDAFLRALGVHRIPVPVPFPDAGGPVNVYAIEDGGGRWALFDAGLGTPEAEAALREGAAKSGVDLSRLSRIIVSHGHVDHFGLAQVLSEQSGAKVYVHASDLEKVTGHGRWVMRRDEYFALFRRLGVPEELLEPIEQAGRRTLHFARSVDAERVQLLDGGERLDFARFSAEVMHLPGHTPGLVCLWAEEPRWLFADDHLLARVSPNPLIELDAQGQTLKALCAYLESARKAHAMDVEWVLPGHGAPFRGHRDLLDTLFQFYERRQEKLLAHLSHREATAYQLVEVLFRKAEVKRLFLTLSEVVGNLEVLEERGAVARREVGGVWQFRAVGPASI